MGRAMAITFSQLRAFHALALTGRHVLAAEMLRVSQPAVTTQIRALEENYSVRLFDRIGHDQKLSELGKQLFTMANQVIHLLDEAEDILVSENDLTGGTLRVGADNPIYVMRVMAAFKHAHPNMVIEVVMGSAASVTKKLLDYEIDVAVVTSTSVPTEFFGRPFYDLALSALVPLGHAWTGRKGISLAEVAADDVILREPGSITRSVFLDALENYGLNANVLLQLGTQFAVREAVAAGLGISVELNGGLQSTVRAELIPIQGLEDVAREYVACHKDRIEVKKVREFFDLAGKVAGSILNK